MMHLKKCAAENSFKCRQVRETKGLSYFAFEKFFFRHHANDVHIEMPQNSSFYFFALNFFTKWKMHDVFFYTFFHKVCWSVI